MPVIIERFLKGNNREPEDGLYIGNSFLVLRDNPLCDEDYISTKGLKPGNASFDDRTYLKFVM